MLAVVDSAVAFLRCRRLINLNRSGGCPVKGPFYGAVQGGVLAAIQPQYRLPVRQRSRSWRFFDAYAISATTASTASPLMNSSIAFCWASGRKRLWRAARIKPAALQNRFYAKTDYDRELRAFCSNKNIVYQSFWTLTANPQILAAPAVTVIAEKYGRTPAQVFFRYLTQSGMACLTGTSSPEHMVQDLAIFDFCLTAREGEAIGAQLR